VDEEWAKTVRPITVFAYPPLARLAGTGPAVALASVKSPDSSGQPDSRPEPREGRRVYRARSGRVGASPPAKGEGGEDCEKLR
jgi:hypothetical protein